MNKYGYMIHTYTSGLGGTREDGETQDPIT